MPTYTVQIRVNVPALGERTVTQTGVVALSIAAAIDQAIKTIVVEPIAAQKTAE